MASKRLVRRVVLERIARPLLARFLATYGADFFAANGVSLEALAASAPRDRSLVHRVFDLVHDRAASPELPAALRTRLALLNALATPAGSDAILRADVRRVLPRSTYGDEDLAAVVLLDHPELAVDARREAEADDVQSFTEYEPEAPQAFALGDAQIAALKDALGVTLVAKDRSPYCTIHVRKDGAHASLEIVYARRPKTFDKVDVASLEVDQSTDIHTERAFVEVDLDRGAVSIHAAPFMKEPLREVLGTVLAGRPQHFRAARVYDLSPFADLEAALSLEGAPSAIHRVELHAIHVQTMNGRTVLGFVRARRDLLADVEARPSLDAALRAGEVVAVKLYLFVTGRTRPVPVALSTKGACNVADFDRSDPDVVAIVRGYLSARGVLRELGAAGSAPPPRSLGLEGPLPLFPPDRPPAVT